LQPYLPGPQVSSGWPSSLRIGRYVNAPAALWPKIAVSTAIGVRTYVVFSPAGAPRIPAGVETPGIWPGR
jgi:integral membrane sensor domain MASE1